MQESQILSFDSVQVLAHALAAISNQKAWAQLFGGFQPSRDVLIRHIREVTYWLDSVRLFIRRDFEYFLEQFIRNENKEGIYNPAGLEKLFSLDPVERIGASAVLIEALLQISQP